MVPTDLVPSESWTDLDPQSDLTNLSIDYILYNFFANLGDWEKLAVFLAGIVVGIGVSIGSFFGYVFPCIGQIFDTVTYLYQMGLYLIYMMGGS